MTGLGPGAERRAVGVRSGADGRVKGMMGSVAER